MSVTWTGLEELQVALRTLPTDLAEDATGIVWGAADGAGRDIIAAYPARTGNLKKGVKVKHAKAALVASATVANMAPHAGLFENGTQARHTKLGASRGSMPPGHVFVPRVIRARRRMYEQLKTLLLQHGAASVTGDA